jgi:hypothetical protein
MVENLRKENLEKVSLIQSSTNSRIKPRELLIGILMIHYHPHLMLVIGAQIVTIKPLVQSTDKVLVRTI